MKSEDSEARSSSPTVVPEDQDWASNDSDALLSSSKGQTAWRQKEFWQWRRSEIKVHAMVFGLYIISIVVMGVALGKAWKKVDRGYLYSAANEAVEWKVGLFQDGNDPHGRYVGEPRPELEKAWGDLLGPMNIRLSQKDVEAFGREKEAIAMSDGTGYVGTLNVFHELHCVRWLHKYLYQDHYWPGLDAKQKKKNLVHSNHCLSTLKSFAMCHGDVGMVIYSWQPESLKPGANGTGHTCVDWQKLHSWSKNRAIDMYKPGLLVHPQLGPAYPNGGDMNHDAIHGP